jgi:bifunctional DNA-binding transcriptional regulator/antitoxin component of YhaV-PrlF toxin-antitoxin module
MKPMAVKEATCTSQIIQSGRTTIDHTVRKFLNLKEGDFVELTVKKVAKPSGRKN